MKCRLCSSKDLKLYYTQGDKDQYSFYRCSNCDLINLDITTLNQEKNQEKYAEDFPDPTDKTKNKKDAQTYSFLKKHLKKTGQYLDIGCGNGALLYLAKHDGWNVKGLELSEYLAKNIKKITGIDVEVANFLDYKNFNSSYDLVSLRHVLEHIPDSINTLTAIGKLIKNNGYALLEFPNIQGISFKIKRLLTYLKLYKKKYKPDYVPGHCNEFSIKAFKYLLKQTNFKLIKWETYSLKPLSYFIYRNIKIGAKTRVLIQKK